MKKYIPIALLILTIGALNSCYENPESVPAENKPPKTFLFLFPDSTISGQQSSLRLSWWGDDPDGLIIGYYITYDDVNWTFTTSTDSLISFPILGEDTTYIFKVAAVDNSGNGVFDQQVIQNGINFGPEPFTDLNSDGVYTAGEPFIDIGAIDPEPASISLPLKNSAPVVNFLADNNGNTIAIPETTYTVASFGWIATDIDGDQTISNLYIALNDTSNKIAIPGSARFITIKAAPPFDSDIVEAEVYIGSSSNPYHLKLPDFRLDAENILFVFAEDIAGALSNIIRMPSESAEKKWYVKKPKGEILIVDDYAPNDNAASVYNAVFDSLGLINKIDIWDIKLFLPPILSPMFVETLKLFKYVFWYTDVSANMGAAQLSVNNYLNSGGKILFSMIFPQPFDSRGLNDFLPVDSITAAPRNVLFAGTPFFPTTEGASLNYPLLRLDNQASRIYGFYPNPFSAVRLYYYDDVSSQQIVGFKSTDSQLVFMGIPLHRANGDPFNLKEFFEKVFFDEFGVLP